MNNLERLPQLLKTKRKQLGMTQSEVSERTGVSVSFISDIEIGRANPSLDTLVKLAECYGMSLFDLWVEIEAQQYKRYVQKHLLEKMVKVLQDELVALEEESKG